jgi:hypothetical protein
MQSKQSKNMALLPVAGWLSEELRGVTRSVLVATTQFHKWKNDTFSLCFWPRRLLLLPKFSFRYRVLPL